jgi:FkbM family methyltransferase
MIRRFILAANKLKFCYTISADLSSFIKLVRNTKKLRRHSKKQISTKPEEPVEYNFWINGQIRKVFLRTYAGDISIFYEIFLYKAYKLPKTIFANSTNIVDAGAHIGLASLYFLSQSPQAKIFSIEPDAENYSILQKNLESMIQSGKVVSIHAALDNKEGILNITRSQFSYNTKVDNGTSAEKVNAVSLNSLVASYNIEAIDILKIDVEGFEQRIFNEHVEWLDHVKNIILETHSSEAYNVCAKTLLNKGFQIKKLSIETENIYWISRP